MLAQLQARYSSRVCGAVMAGVYVIEVSAFCGPRRSADKFLRGATKMFQRCSAFSRITWAYHVLLPPPKMLEEASYVFSGDSLAALIPPSISLACLPLPPFPLPAFRLHSHSLGLHSPHSHRSGPELLAPHGRNISSIPSFCLLKSCISLLNLVTGPHEACTMMLPVDFWYSSSLLPQLNLASSTWSTVGFVQHWKTRLKMFQKPDVHASWSGLLHVQDFYLRQICEDTRSPTCVTHLNPSEAVC